MFWIELSISVFNVIAIWLTTHRYIFWGCISGAIAQIGWVVLFCYTEQLGIVPMEILLACIYFKHLRKHFRRQDEN